MWPVNCGALVFWFKALCAIWLFIPASHNCGAIISDWSQLKLHYSFIPQYTISFLQNSFLFFLWLCKKADQTRTIMTIQTTFEWHLNKWLLNFKHQCVEVPPSFQFIEKHIHRKKKKTLQHIYMLSLIRGPSHVVLLHSSEFQQIMHSLFGFELFFVCDIYPFQRLINIRVVFLLHKVAADLFNNLLIG